MSALRGFKAISTTYSGDSPEDLVRIDVSHVQSTVLVSGNDDADLLIDFDTWRRAPIATQKIYYGQFLHFASRNCVYHRFNVKRLIRMRLVKQLLNALKGENPAAQEQFVSTRTGAKSDPSGSGF